MPKAKRKTGRTPCAACCVYFKGWKFFPRSLLPSSLSTKPHSSPGPRLHAGERFGELENFSQSSVSSAHPGVMGRELMPSARPGPETPPIPPTRDVEAESILPKNTCLKGNMGFIPKSKQGSLPSCKLSSALGTQCLPGWSCVCWQHLGCGTAVTAVPIPAAWPSGWLPYPWQGGETRWSSRSFLTQNHRMAYDSLGRRRETGNSGGGRGGNEGALGDPRKKEQGCRGAKG